MSAVLPGQQWQRQSDGVVFEVLRNRYVGGVHYYPLDHSYTRIREVDAQGRPREHDIKLASLERLYSLVTTSQGSDT